MRQQGRVTPESRFPPSFPLVLVRLACATPLGLWHPASEPASSVPQSLQGAAIHVPGVSPCLYPLAKHILS